MILAKTSIITLDYNPATDILQADYPDLIGFQIPEIKRSLTIMVEAIRNYDVKKLLLDASKTTIEVSQEESSAITRQLAVDLVNTRLQKVARIQPVDNNRERTAQENINQIGQAGLLPYQLQTFTHKSDAMAWLMGN